MIEIKKSLLNHLLLLGLVVQKVRAATSYYQRLEGKQLYLGRVWKPVHVLTHSEGVVKRLEWLKVIESRSH